MNDLEKDQYGIVYKLDFSTLTAGGAVPSTIPNNNTVLSDYNLYIKTPNSNYEVIDSNDVNVLSIKTKNSQIYTASSKLGDASGTTQVRYLNFQVEMEILIPSLDSNNMFFGISDSSAQRISFNIKNVFENGLEIFFANKYVSCNYSFESNKKYNITISKVNDVFTFYIDGLVVGFCKSSDFISTMTFKDNYLSIGADYYSTTNGIIGEISNINISSGNFLKYQNSFTKYGNNLLSRYNFDNMATTDTSTIFTCGVESVEDSPFVWTVSDSNFIYNSGYSTVNSSFYSSIQNLFRIQFKIKNNTNHDNINIINLNDKYKLIYNFFQLGEPEPTVIVDTNATSALDFENRIIDQVATTVWNKGGTADTTNTNVIYGDNSFKTNALGDNLNTTSTVVTGNGDKFEFEFYLLVNKDQSHMNGLGGSSLPILSQYEGTLIRNGLYITSPFEVTYTTPFIFRNVNHTGSALNSYYSEKIEPNTINKINLSYDGSATRLFKNDVLINVFGGTYIHNYDKTYLMGALNTDSTATKGLIDNINIFDGVAKTVRNKDEYADKLIVDLAFDGENNSTNIVDSGTLGITWNIVSNSYLSTDDKYTGYSSLKSVSTSQATFTNANGLNLSNLDFTFEIVIKPTSLTTSAYQVILANASNTPNKVIFNIHNDNFYFGIYDLLPTIQIPFPTSLVNKWSKLTYIRKDNILYGYLNDVLMDTKEITNVDINVDLSQYGGLNLGKTGWSANDSMIGFINSFKIYKGVAIEPSNPKGKINLEFDNNINDKYSNSTWVNTNVTYDQINSVKGYSAKFTGSNTNLKANNTENLNFKNNFNINVDIMKTSAANNYPCVLGSATTAWQTSGSKNPNISFHNSNNVNISFNNATTEHSISTQAFMNNFYNYDLKRRANTLFLSLNDVVRNSKNINGAITNIPFNEGSGTYLGSAGWSVSNSQNFIGNIDNFNSFNEDLTNDIILYKQGTSVRLLSIEDECYKLATQTYTANENTSMYLQDSPVLKNFVAEIKVYLKSGGLNSCGLNFRTLNDIIKQANQGGNIGYYALINGNTLLLGKGTNSLTATPVSLGSISISSYANNNYHTLKVVAIDSSIKVYMDDNLLIDATDTTHDISTQFYLHYYINQTGITSKVKSVKIWDETQTTLLYDKNWQSNVIVDQYNPTVQYPFDTNLLDIGFAQLAQSTSGTFNYTTIDNKKCVQFAASTYMQMTSDARTLYKFDSDFYIEFEVYPTANQFHTILSNGASNTTNLYAITMSSSSSSLVSKVYMYLNGYTDPTTGLSISTSNSYNYNQWNNVKIYRQADQLTIELNGIKTVYTYTGILDFQYNNYTRIGTPAYTAGGNINGYMSKFIMINGVSKLPDDFNENLVIDVDFSPTRKSYLFKDNAYKNVLHPINITNRDYLNSKYACTFNGTDQCIQLGKQSSMNFNNDDFVLRIDFDWQGSSNLYGCLIANGQTAASNMDFILVLGSSNKLGMRASNTVIIQDTDNVDIPNGFNKLVLVRNGSSLDVYLNDVFVITKAISSQFNLNFNNNTFIGKNTWDGANGFFKGSIHKIKAYRNTTDITLVDDQFYSANEKFSLTNGTDIVDLEFTEIEPHDINIISDVDKITVNIDDNAPLEVSKDTEVDNVVLFENYLGGVNDIRVYDTPFYDNDIYLGSQLIDTEIPEISLENNTQELQIFDVGDYNLKGFIEGYTDRPFVIYNKVEEYVLYQGIEEYETDIDFNFIDELEIRDLVSDQRYLVNASEMIKGYISGTINLTACGIAATDMEVFCYRSDNYRHIGTYSVDKDGKYVIPNLDVNSRYDIIFRDKTKKIKDQISNYRKPMKY